MRGAFLAPVEQPWELFSDGYEIADTITVEQSAGGRVLLACHATPGTVFARSGRLLAKARMA
ncbi:hypothetical protein [Mycobacterium colombiense]|uniref:hypothetical protein n=1 Tax=Mycobacterium colombiense TaxID=339268 RepID=UPI0008007343|nr:hypothetical protein [Mycobacterium colombiense]OBJ79289.1 hypothetical protein A5627_12990 [Mycobacterium colombiense]